jgi:3'(2'), 5'-bisphosphate nucleotidase
VTDNTLDAQLAAVLEPVIDLTRDAGRRILEIYETDFEVAHKADHTPVTAADWAAHNAIAAGLDVLAPQWPVLSEEAPDIAFEERRAWHTYWLVDPLDGTREFVRRSGQFSVNIALVHDQRPVLGVVHMPISGATYFARAGQPAFKQDAGHLPRPIRARTRLHQPPVVAISRLRHGSRLERFLNHLGPHETYSMGSSLKSCLVAEGTADLYPCLGPTSEWDTAAAQCIVEQAGGLITDTNMQPLRYNTKDSLLNPEFFAFGDRSEDWSKFLAVV